MTGPHATTGASGDPIVRAPVPLLPARTAGGIRVGLTLVVLAGAVLVVWPVLMGSESRRLAREAAQAFSREQWPHARALAESSYEQDDSQCDALAIAGIAAARMHQNPDALRYLEQFRALTPTADPLTRAAVLVELGRRYRRLGRLDDAERCFHDVLEIDQQQLEAHRQLSHLLSFEGRCAEAAPHLLAVVQSGQFRADELCLLGIPDRIVIDDDRLREQCQAHDPEDPLRLLGQARVLVDDHHLTLAEEIAQRIVSRYPHLPLAHALLGQIYLEQNRHQEFLDWNQTLPEEVANAPEIWFVRGSWARQTRQLSAAVRCLLETLRSNPNDVEANYQLSQLLQQLKEPERARFFSERSLQLSTLGYVINDLRGNPDLKLMRQAVEALEQLGRGWEALAWSRMAIDWKGDGVADLDSPANSISRLGRTASREPGGILAARHPLREISPEEYPLPDWTNEPSNSNLPSTADETAREVRFTDVAAQAGVDFQYFNSMNPDIGLEHIFQTTGGGVAAVDFDLDFWPDLYPHRSLQGHRPAPTTADVRGRVDAGIQCRVASQHRRQRGSGEVPGPGHDARGVRGQGR